MPDINDYNIYKDKIDSVRKQLAWIEEECGKDETSPSKLEKRARQLRELEDRVYETMKNYRTDLPNHIRGQEIRSMFGIRSVDFRGVEECPDCGVYHVVNGKKDGGCSWHDSKDY